MSMFERETCRMCGGVTHKHLLGHPDSFICYPCAMVFTRNVVGKLTCDAYIRGEDAIQLKAKEMELLGLGIDSVTFTHGKDWFSKWGLR